MSKASKHVDLSTLSGIRARVVVAQLKEWDIVDAEQQLCDNICLDVRKLESPLSLQTLSDFALECVFQIEQSREHLAEQKAERKAEKRRAKKSRSS